MKEIRLATAIVFLLLVTTNAHSYSHVYARINGTVRAEDGKPIEGVRVILMFSEDGTKYELTTDRNGNWRKFNIRPGTWTIGFLVEGYEPQNVTVQISAIRSNAPVDIKLSRVPESPLRRGDILYQEKKYAEALREYQRVLEENPGLHRAYSKIGLCYYRLNDLEKAVKAFKLMLDREPRSRDTLINLSAIYFEKGKLEEGMKYFQQLDESTLIDPGIFYNIGLLLFRNGETDRAIEYFKKCLALAPGNIDGYYQLALANLNMGDTEEAKRNFQKVIELDPGSDKAALARKILESIK